jgi:glycosyltransferase involved in cell wall biosynthesis
MSKIMVVCGFPDSLLHFRGELLAAFQESGLIVHVAAPDVPRECDARLALEERGYVVHCTPLQRAGVNPFGDLVYMLKLFFLFRKIKPKYVFLYTVKPVIFGAIAAKFANIEKRIALVTGLGYAFVDGGGERALVSRVVPALYKLAMRCINKVFFQNDDDYKLFLRLGILPPRNSVCVVNGSGVNIVDYCPAALPSGLSFLMIARLLGDKGVREYVAAARAIKTRNPEIIFSLVGWIDENPDAVSAVELGEWVERGDIEYLGKLSDVRPAIATSSVYVLPSYREGLPRTVIEAMAMGRPIITTDAPGCRDTVIDGVNGYLVPVRAVDKLIEAMLVFRDDPSLVTKMGSESRRMAEEKYDVRMVNKIMLQEIGIE